MYTSSSFANFLFPIYRIAFMQGSLSDERNVRPFVRPFVCQTRELWKTEKKLMRKFLYP